MHAWLNRGLVTNFEVGNVAYGQHLDRLFSNSASPRPALLHPSPLIAFRVDLFAKSSRFLTCATSIAATHLSLKKIRFHNKDWANSRRLVRIVTDLGSECYSFKRAAASLGRKLNQAHHFGFSRCPMDVAAFMNPVAKKLGYCIAFRGRYVHDKEHSDLELERLEAVELLTLGDRSPNARKFVRDFFYAAKTVWLGRAGLAHSFAYEHVCKTLANTDEYYDELFRDERQ